MRACRNEVSSIQQYYYHVALYIPTNQSVEAEAVYPTELHTRGSMYDPASSKPHGIG
jgi:hypothetical protein